MTYGPDGGSIVDVKTYEDVDETNLKREVFIKHSKCYN